MITLILATRNKHKVGEIRAILEPGCRCLPLDGSNQPLVKEDAATFAGNASKKAIALARCLTPRRNPQFQSNSLFVLADDSGLEVDALNGAPGVYSARFAAVDTGHSGNSTDAENNQKLLRLLKDVPAEKRTARFLCVLALAPVVDAQPKPASPVCYADEVELQVELFEGVCEGRILFEARGSEGFGYDPLFVPTGYQCSFAELGEVEKNHLSHRAKALEKLKQRLETVRK